MAGAWIDLIDVGTHRGEEYTLRDLRDMVRNFYLAKRLVDPPFYVGHEETQPLLAGIVENTGDPAVGWVDALRVVRDDDPHGRKRWVLQCRPADMHPKIVRLIKAKAYRKVSPEIYDEGGLPEGMPPGVRGKMLRRVALMGGHPQQIKTLNDVPVSAFAERAWRVKRAGRLARYAEGKGMDRAQMTEVLLNAGWTQEEIDGIKDDVVLGVIVAHEMREATGGGEPPPDATANADAPMPGVGGLPDRATMTADLIAAGHTQEELDAMSDADLAALWQQEVGASTMSETPTTPPRAAATPQAPAVRPAATMTPAQFSEAVRREAWRQVRAAVAPVVRAQRAAEQEAHADRVRKLCERWSREGKVLPGEIDPKSELPNLYLRLLAASRTRVRKYGEKTLSDFDAMAAEVESRPVGFARRNFGERIADPQNAGAASRYEAVREAVRKQYGTQATAGRSLEERLRLLPPAGLR